MFELPQKKRQRQISSFSSLRTERKRETSSTDTNNIGKLEVFITYTNNLDWMLDYSWNNLEMQTNEGDLNLATEIAQVKSSEYSVFGKGRRFKPTIRGEE